MISGGKQLVLYTDLDGTLLDPVTYSWKAALSALQKITEHSIPLVLCSSKTRAEIEVLRRQLNNHDPFISENGGGVFIPHDYFDFPFSYTKKIGSYRVIELGLPYPRLVEALRSVSGRTPLGLRGYSDLSPEEIASRTGLTMDEARRARQREYDEPFILQGSPGEREHVLKQIEDLGFRWTQGALYYHLTGDNDKGKAVRILTGLFQQRFGRITTVALGDSPNDRPMLEAVDHPVLVRKPGGVYDETMALLDLHRADGIGPAGWNSAVLGIIQDPTARQS